MACRALDPDARMIGRVMWITLRESSGTYIALRRSYPPRSGGSVTLPTLFEFWAYSYPLWTTLFLDLRNVAQHNFVHYLPTDSPPTLLSLSICFNYIN